MLTSLTLLTRRHLDYRLASNEGHIKMRLGLRLSIPRTSSTLLSFFNDFLTPGPRHQLVEEQIHAGGTGEAQAIQRKRRYVFTRDHWPLN